MAVSSNIVPVKVLDPLGMVEGSPQEITVQKYMSWSNTDRYTYHLFGRAKRVPYTNLYVMRMRTTRIKLWTLNEAQTRHSDSGQATGTPAEGLLSLRSHIGIPACHSYLYLLLLGSRKNMVLNLAPVRLYSQLFCHVVNAV